MKINSNSTAVITNNYLLRTESALDKSTQRLSSGYKINNAKDNPAGYAISSKMRAQIRSLEKATDNADTGVDFIDTCDGALTEIQDMTQRMNELSIKAANGTMTVADREAIQSEIDQLSEEIERIANDTDFNDQTIFNGNFEYRGYTDQEDVKVFGYSDNTQIGTYTVSGLSVTKTLKYDEDGNQVYDKDGNEVYEYEMKSGGSVTDADGNAIVPSMTAEIREDSNIVTYSNNAGFEFSLEINEAFSGDVEVKMEKLGAMRIQVGDNEGQVIEMSIPEVSLKKMGIDNIDVTTEDGAKKAIDKAQGAIDYVSAVRSKLGAYQNRLEHTSSSLDITVESLNSSYSTLTDTDMAAEMTEYTKLQVLQQAGTSMLAQANEFPQQALQLLQ